MNRRDFATALAAVIGIALHSQPNDAVAQPRRRARRRVRRRVRRRFRRVAVTRMVRGRRLWVVPVGLAIGWELVHENRVVVVKETKFVERDGANVEVVVVQDSAGATEEVEVLREDTAANRKELDGSILGDNDRSTPGVEAEIEEDVEE